MRLAVSAPEAHWCCTMRGGEGLSAAVRYTCFSRGKDVWMPFLRSGSFTMPLSRGALSMEVSTGYPFDGHVEVAVKDNSAGQVSLRLPAPSWTTGAQLTLNGKPVTARHEQGFLVLKRKFRPGDRVVLDFQMPVRVEKPLNSINMDASWRRIFAGPLMLGSDQPTDITLPQTPQWQREGKAEWSVKGTGIRLTPIYHLLDSRVWSDTGYSKQILF